MKGPPPDQGGGPLASVQQSGERCEDKVSGDHRQLETPHRIGRPPAQRVVVAALSRNDRSEWRVILDVDRRGDAVLDIRVFEDFAGPAKALTGTKVGVTVPLDRLYDLINALSKAAVVALEVGLISDRMMVREPAAPRPTGPTAQGERW